jgi:hypothetical protein
MRLPAGAQRTPRFEDVLGGIVMLEGSAEAERVEDWSGALYRTEPPGFDAVPLKAAPYFAWDNREPAAGEEKQADPCRRGSSAIWCAAGVEWGEERRVGPRDLGSLMYVFRELGVPPELTSATHFAVRRAQVCLSLILMCKQ